MTTCNRLDLTKRSLDPFLLTNPGVDEIYMMDLLETLFLPWDIQSLLRQIVDHNNQPTIVRKNIRHMHNIQQLFEKVKTKRWVHLEDDWEFTRYGFVKDSIGLLKNSPLYMIIGRQPNTFKPKVDYWVDDRHGVLAINRGPGGRFTSYTAYPAVLNTEKVLSLIGDFTKFRGEWDVSKYLGVTYGTRVGIWKNNYYYHIGDGKSTMHIN